MAGAERAFKVAIKNNPHLGEYLKKWKAQRKKVPKFVIQPGRDIPKEDLNIIYPVGDPIFIHAYRDETENTIKYHAIEPQLTEPEEKKYRETLELILEKAPYEEVPENEEGLRNVIKKLLNDSVIIKENEEEEEEESPGWMRLILPKPKKITMTKLEYDKIKYFIERDIIGSGVIEPLIRDPYIEDIHSIGTGNIHIIHKIFDMVETNVRFKDDLQLTKYLRSMCERIGRPVSEAHPIVDGALPDGSRLNAIYSNDVSRRGPSFTIRKFSSTPISIVQLVGWGTVSAEIAGYLWLCLENGMSIFVCGETASGKTTALNAMLPFILPQAKIFTAEDTAEVLPPHEIWQQLITREEGPEDSRVTLFDLLKAALRSRPNYIIVGEIRGAEGAVAFQAMQTGHPVLATFHASSVKKMIQRFTGDPINVPITFIDNLNIALIQQAVYRKGKFLRRCTSVEEIEGYYEDAGGVVTRAVFQWDPGFDKHYFRGMNNSYILEQKIAETLGYQDKRQIYEDMMYRARIISRMLELGIMDYYQVNKIIVDFYRKGPESLPFSV
ncbi:MAG TPA: hypothetical protein ENG09_01650 [Candidatus Syntrophoarchaeum butanivorans]|uniref:Bacterial type II secretion system protein E domain-containing protein n=1 Tax=Candidatus Syntropharchaeum butanivorans TaxID=1839936 RepID=A0A7C0X3U7_9EURY|nr:hypothetical protein [Candidatus Syntrophoarchaeum butanivorans]